MPAVFMKCTIIVHIEYIHVRVVILYAITKWENVRGNKKSICISDMQMNISSEWDFVRLYIAGSTLIIKNVECYIYIYIFRRLFNIETLSKLLDMSWVRYCHSIETEISENKDSTTKDFILHLYLSMYLIEQE